jgi:hypothetical protein
MTRLFLIFFILKISNNFCQNLVPNPSFEIYTACPSGDFQIELATPWFSPNATTLAQKASYFNTCATNSIFVIPYFDGTDYRQPHTGNAFGGNLWSYTPGNNNLRKYITTSLTNSLVTNNYYYISFYASTFLRGFKYAINNLGAYVSAGVPYNSNPNAVLNYTPQIIKYGNPIINDTINWIKIDGIYLANGNENYITIGNFMDDINTDTAFIGSGFYGASNYYIDDVSVINISTPQWQYRDTSVVIGDSVLIGPAISGLNVDWFTMINAFIKNAPGIYVKPTTTTSYQATETFNSVVYNHTVTVTVLITKTNEYDKLQNSIKLFPNPNAGIVNLKWDDIKNGEAKVMVLDITGKVVFDTTLQITNGLSNFNLNLSPGTFLVKIINPHTNMSVNKKLMIQ